jgi:hypothetical protein
MLRVHCALVNRQDSQDSNAFTPSSSDHRAPYDGILLYGIHVRISSLHVFIATPRRLPPNWILSLQGWAWHGMQN